MLEKKNHLLALDGLRGVAALCVTLYHAGSSFSIDHFFPRSFLAVDFFFILSGYVLAMSYEPRLENGLTFLDFLRIRSIRLIPMIWLGLFIGALVQVSFNQPLSGKLLISSMFFIPAPHEPGLSTDVLFPLNVVEWSLMLEIGINIIHIACARFLKFYVLIGAVALGFAGIVWSAIHFQGLDSGFNPETWMGGPCRCLFAYGLGIFLWRISLRFKMPSISFGLAAFITFVLFFLPGGGTSKIAGIVRDILSVAVIFPIIIAGTAQSAMTGRVAKIAAFAGFLSYPLYALHEPILKWVSHLSDADHLMLPPRFLALLTALTISIIISYASLCLVDQPVRKWLSTLSLRRKVRYGA